MRWQAILPRRRLWPRNVDEETICSLQHRSQLSAGFNCTTAYVLMVLLVLVSEDWEAVSVSWFMSVSFNDDAAVPVSKSVSSINQSFNHIFGSSCPKSNSGLGSHFQKTVYLSVRPLHQSIRNIFVGLYLLLNRINGSHG